MISHLIIIYINTLLCVKKNNIKISSQLLCTYLMRLTIAAGVIPGILLAAPILQGDIYFSRKGTDN